MKPSFPEYLQSAQQRVNNALVQLSQQRQSEFSGHDDASLDATLYEAMAYCLLNGGKRVRATLVYASAEAVNNNCSIAT